MIIVYKNWDEWLFSWDPPPLLCHWWKFDPGRRHGAGKSMMKPRGPSSCWYSSDMCNQARITRALVADIHHPPPLALTYREYLLNLFLTSASGRYFHKSNYDSRPGWMGCRGYRYYQTRRRCHSRIRKRKGKFVLEGFQMILNCQIHVRISSYKKTNWFCFRRLPT